MNGYDVAEQFLNFDTVDTWNQIIYLFGGLSSALWHVQQQHRPLTITCQSHSIPSCASKNVSQHCQIPPDGQNFRGENFCFGSQCFKMLVFNIVRIIVKIVRMEE